MQIQVIGSTDKEVRLQVQVNGTENGELHMGREDFTRFVELLCTKNYVIQSMAEHNKVLQRTEVRKEGKSGAMVDTQRGPGVDTRRVPIVSRVSAGYAPELKNGSLAKK